MLIQDDLFGYEAPPKIVREKKIIDPRLADFKKRNGAYLNGYVMFVLNTETINPNVPEHHAYLNFTECEKRVETMCNAYGMIRTVASEGLVASGNGRFLYKVLVHKVGSA